MSLFIDTKNVPNQITITNTNPLKVISLFSGCGGMDLGFIGDFNSLGNFYPKQPFEIIFANDIFEKACQTYQHNFNHNIICQDISTIDDTDIPKADIVIGGFPCQDFSLAGKRKGLDSERGKLYLQMKRVIQIANPKAFVAENVDGIRKAKGLSKNDASALDVIIKDFSQIGYNVVYQVLNASHYGVAQNRVRVIIVGIRKDIDKEMKYPKPLFGELSDSQKPVITSKQAIDDLWELLDDNINSHSKNHYSKAKFYPNKKLQGNCQINADKPAPTIRAEHHGNIEAHYRSTNKKSPYDMQYWRRLTVRECARLQSFPDDFIFPTSASSSYVQVGNAVPPIMAWHIANALYQSVFE